MNFLEALSAVANNEINQMSTNCRRNTLWLICKIDYLKELSIATYSNIYNIEDEKAHIEQYILFDSIYVMVKSRKN